MQLVVTSPFGDYQKGDRITKKADVERILGTANEVNVVKVADAPVPDAKSTEKAGG